MNELSTSAPMAGGLPRELVLASAGTGKTYTLSGRIISLLAAGAPPDTLLASTFTRKAAGEILNRVLARLAEAGLSVEKARALAEETRTPGIHPPPQPEPEFFLGLLKALVQDLHRLNVGTLDSFFMRVARGFSPDLGLRPGWVITDEPGAQALEAEALQSILADSSQEEMVELVRMAMRGDWGRGVHSKLLDQLQTLRELTHQVEPPEDGDLWGPSLGSTSSPVSLREWQEVAARLAQAPIPATKAGKPDGRFVRAVEPAVEALLEGDWEVFCRKGLAAKLLQGESAFFGKEIPLPLETILRDGLKLAKRSLTLELSKQAGALERLTAAFDDTLSSLQRGQGAFRFQDIAFLLGGADPVGTRLDIWYRLDQQARHLLLDEFQDTSLTQWEALQPLVSELLSGHLEDRSATVVADPKQSIYGWRGADPLLVHRVESSFPLQKRTLERSYRSAEPVLRLVTRVFEDLSENPVWRDSEENRRQAGIWAQGFAPHLAAREIPGYVRILAGPEEENMAGSDRPLMMAWVSERVAELVAEAPGATLGVLVRQNAAVSRLIMELRARGVAASEEGATALEDSPAVSTVLALLRLADHPGDTLAAYQVSHSPLGQLFRNEVGEGGSWAVRTASRVRRSLLSHGYGATLTSWVRDLGAADTLSRRDLQRLLQLTELAYRWDIRSTLRPGDFVRFAQAERMEAPSDARVRVMTVHQAKGLEFDQVVLPELDLRLTTGRGRHGGVFPLRDPETGRVIRILPRVHKALHPLIPEMEEAARQEGASELRDALGVLYVALTRARHALHIFMAEDTAPDSKKLSFTFAGLIRGGLGLEGIASEAGQVLLEMGNSEWIEKTDFGVRAPRTPVGEDVEEEGEARIPRPRLARKSVRRRNLHHRTASSLAGHGKEKLKALLSLEREEVRQKGSIVHRWLEDFTWIEEWKPDPEILVAQARGLAPGMSTEQIQKQLVALKRWLSGAEVRTRLSRSSYPAHAQIKTEYPFALSLAGEFYSGLVDRVVLVHQKDVLERVQILDFKTDRIAAGDETLLAETVEAYRPQVELYRKALSRLLRLEKGRVEAGLIFLVPGRVVDLHGP